MYNIQVLGSLRNKAYRRFHFIHEGGEMPKSKILAIAMLGMNNSSEQDTDHPFTMQTYIDKYDIVWLETIRDIEKYHSTPFYEMAKAIDELATQYSIPANNIKFIFGRGCWGDSTEKDLNKKLKAAKNDLGDNTYRVIFAKSFGAIDTLRAFNDLGSNAETEIGKIDLMCLADPTATLFSRKSVTKKIKVNGKREERLMIPTFINKIYNVYQDYHYPRGLRAGRPSDNRIKNHEIFQDYVDSFGATYDHYNDGYKRDLIVKHRNMEEIVSAIPCCDWNGIMLTFPEAIKKGYEES